MSKTVLIVEDERPIVEILKFNLKREGYETLEALDGRTGLELGLSRDPDLVLLDVMLPEMNGFDVCAALRDGGSTAPIIMLTAREEESDKVFGLEAGADDYITKPFAIEELLARIRTALRKRPQGAGAGQKLACGPVVMDVARHVVTCDGKPVELTSREFDVLKLMMENQQIVLSRDTFLTKVWGYDYMGETNVVDVYIRYLRSKLDDAYGVELIHTVRGVGYVLREG